MFKETFKSLEKKKIIKPDEIDEMKKLRSVFGEKNS